MLSNDNELETNNLIETFCIVNTPWVQLAFRSVFYLIETFCIVNFYPCQFLSLHIAYLIETFCIVNIISSIVGTSK